jgi:hypothetical protein
VTDQPNQHAKRTRMRRLKHAIVAAFALLSLAYLALLPSFEGPDEPEHIAHLRAFAEGATLRAPTPGAAPEWGYEIVQPPVYYVVAGAWARVIGPEFARRIVINPTQNARFPFIRHDLAGERFPWTAEHRGLRWLRLPSVVFGLLTAWVLLGVGRRLFGGDSWPLALWLGAALLTPSILQAFATVSNDGLAILLSCMGLAAAMRVSDLDARAARWAAVCGLALGVAISVKVTAILAAATVGTVLGVDALQRRGVRRAFSTLGAAAAPLLTCVAALLLSNHLRFGDPTLQRLNDELLPSLIQPVPTPVPLVLEGIAALVPPSFGVDLAWQTVRLPGLALSLFWSWLAACLVVAASLLARRQTDPAAWLGLVALGLSLTFMIWMLRTYTNLQVRLLLVVWPVLMLPLGAALRALPPRWEAVRGALATAAILGLLVGNGILLVRFGALHQPDGNPAFDRDYHTYVYTYVRNTDRADLYLRSGTHQLYDIRAAYRREDWESVIQLVTAEALPEEIAPTAEHLRAVALAQLGQVSEALEVLAALAPSYAPARATHVALLLSSRGPDVARPQLEKYLQGSEGLVRAELLELDQRMSGPASDVD